MIRPSIVCACRWAVCTALLVAALAQPAAAYLKYAVPVGDRAVTLQWRRTPIQYFVADGGVPGVASAGFADAVARAFATWEAVPTASVAYQFSGFTSASPGDDDGRSTLGFRAQPDMQLVLASASLLIDELTGELIEVDITFNSTFAWSVAPAGEAGRFDVETIALHEIGHLSGLSHSAIGETEVTGTGFRVLAAESVMFPIAFGPGIITNRSLRADDIAGISDLYPDGGFGDATGSISGTVTKDGAGLFGAHVVAFNPATGKLVGNFTLNSNGQFSIAGLAPGPHVIRVEPLDDADVESFFEVDTPLDVDFRSLFHNRLIVVPRGGDSGSVEITAFRK